MHTLPHAPAPPAALRRFFRRPSARLARYVERFWGWECDEDEIALPTLTPGLGAELIFHYGAPFRAQVGAATAALPRAFVVCVRKSTLALAPQRRLGFVAVRVRAGMLGRFANAPLREVADGQVSLETLWGAAGRDAREYVHNARSWEEAVRLLEPMLEARLSTARTDAVAERAAALIYEAHAAQTIESVARQCGLGRRQLERRVEAHFGERPVELRRLARFYAVARSIALRPATQVLDAALQAGFYDQAHLVREFRRFAGTTPARFRRAMHDKTHFYNSK